MQNKILIFIPTYNEHGNVEGILHKLLDLRLPTDILFLDDNSPDGTGVVLDALARKHTNVEVIHRDGKLGIGSAHIQGINWAFDHGYEILITMDCDFTHSPENIGDFIANSKNVDVVVGSRFLQEKSLTTWTLYRKLQSNLAHLLTVRLLKMPYDATGAFRLYRLDRLPRNFLEPVYAHGYAFFWESLYVLHINNFTIREIPIALPARISGDSKMRLKDVLLGVLHLVRIYITTLINREQLELSEPLAIGQTNEGLDDKQGWGSYWGNKQNAVLLMYDIVAAFYRKFIIKPALSRYIKKYFDEDSILLHAGCGSGQVDREIGKVIPISALDISSTALSIYKKSNKNYRDLIHGSIFAIPVPDGVFDGIYNLGVMEHFTEEEIGKILHEFKRVLRSRGKIILFWPPEYGLSVIFLKFAHFFLNRILKKNISLHPAEPTRVRSKKQIEAYLRNAGFSLTGYYFGPRDIFTYTVVIGEKI